MDKQEKRERWVRNKDSKMKKKQYCNTYLKTSGDIIEMSSNGCGMMHQFQVSWDDFRWYDVTKSWNTNVPFTNGLRNVECEYYYSHRRLESEWVVNTVLRVSFENLMTKDVAWSKMMLQSFLGSRYTKISFTRNSRWPGH